MTTKASATRATDDYFDLVRKFPLRKIKTDAENDQALAVLRPLMRRAGPLTSGEAEYFDALVVLIKEFEHRTMPAHEKVTPLELLKHLMEENHMNVNALGKIIGSVPAASMILNGKRSISKTQAKRLGERFALNPGAFI